MASEPRVSHAVRGEDTRLHAPRRWLPVVYVHGIMGSRLYDPETGEPVWNPMGPPVGGDPGPFCVNYQRITQLRELVPASDFEPSPNPEIPNLSGLMKDFYHTGVELLLKELTKRLTPHGVKPKIYCCA